jgi:hypothetical protein
MGPEDSRFMTSNPRIAHVGISEALSTSLKWAAREAEQQLRLAFSFLWKTTDCCLTVRRFNSGKPPTFLVAKH